jgi:hypothetical protein
MPALSPTEFAGATHEGPLDTVGNEAWRKKKQKQLVVDRSVAMAHRINLKRRKFATQAIVKLAIMVLPFTAHAPTAVIGDLYPDVAFDSMMQNVERYLWELRLARLLYRGFYCLSLRLSERQCVCVNHHLLSPRLHSAPQNEIQNHT